MALSLAQRGAARVLVASSLVLAIVAVRPSSLSAQDSLTLRDAISMAQERGLAGRAARNAREAAQWRQQAFSARRLPQLSLTGNLPQYNRAIIPVLQPGGETQFRTQSQTTSSLGLQLSQVIPFTGGQLFLSSELTRVDQNGSGVGRLWQSTPVMIGIQQQLFRPNELAWDGREQTLDDEIAERQYLEAREDVAIATATAFFDLYAARLRLENATNNVAVNDTLYTLSQGRYQVGKIGENDLLQSELALLRARSSLDGARLEYDRAMAALRLQLKVPADSSFAIAAPVNVPVMTVDTAVAVAEALRNRSQMASFDLQKLQADRRINAARLSNGFGATITARAGFNQTAPILGDAYQSLLDQQALSVTVSMPLVQWGARHADVEAARADKRRVENTTDQSREQAAQEAHFAALEFMQAARILEISAKADTVGSKRFEVAKNRYVIGKIGISDLYIAQSEKDGALESYVQALRAYWLSYYRLRRLTLYDFAEGERIAR
ncbi:MAG TPA: TolC family protein [Gemmatimonadaceae bacterium]|nr:TolC family protein [Gemmatimonadaceae bacterium]